MFSGLCYTGGQIRNFIANIYELLSKFATSDETILLRTQVITKKSMQSMVFSHYIDIKTNV